MTSMTIQSFSERTGLPASTIRYYEKEGLLQPSHRASNGYRYFREDQIAGALKIHTLRQAGISLIDIRQYLAADAEGQAGWLRKWRQDVDEKLLALNVAKQYLDGVDAVDEHIRLVRWSQPTRILWFRHRVKRQLHPFAQAIDTSASYLEKRGQLYAQEAYVRQEGMVGDEMRGKVGFRLPLKPALPGSATLSWTIKIRACRIDVSCEGADLYNAKTTTTCLYPRIQKTDGAAL